VELDEVLSFFLHALHVLDAPVFTNTCKCVFVPYLASTDVGHT